MRRSSTPPLPILAAVLFVALAASCGSSRLSSADTLVDRCAGSGGLYTMNATLWQQTAVEYRAVAAQTYASARLMLDRALADPTWNALPDVATRPDLAPAVILDLDETVFDNWRYQTDLLRRGTVHSTQEFARFEAGGGADAVEGARDFLNYAASRGVRIFYITNRKDVAGGRRSLKALELPVTDESLMFKGPRPGWNVSDKTSRRNAVAERHRVLLLLGDDFNDFVHAHGKSIAERTALFERHKSMFGTKWFALPNAMYGSWEAAVNGEAETERDKCAAKYRAVEQGTRR